MERNVFTAEQETWLKALESGEFKQCRGKLHNEGGHCCLGIATLVLGLDELYGYGLAPSAVVALHMRGAEGAFLRATEEAGCLTRLNDKGDSFPQIAAFIRANPWQVFTNFDAPTPAADRGEG